MCLRLLTNMIIIMFKMKFSAFIVFLIVLTYSNASGMRNREHYKALIPNNDVGRHEMLKELLSEYDIDPSELIASDYMNSNSDEEEGLEPFNSLPIIQPADSNIERNDDRERTVTTRRPSTTTTSTTKKPATTTTKKPTTAAHRSDGSSEGKPSKTSVSSTTLSPSLSTTQNMKEDTTENTLFTLSTTTTSHPFPSNPSYNADCLLGKVSEILQWVDVNGVLLKNFILSNEDMKDLEFLDKSNTTDTKYLDLGENVGILSLAFNNLKQIPAHVIDNSYFSIQYLSLTGNDFKDLSTPLNLPNLKNLDLRNCQLKSVERNLFENLKKLEYLYLSNNNIASLDDESFHLPSLIHLDLSFNQEKTQDGVLPNPLKMTPKVFEKLINLQFLDFSHTKIEVRAIPSLDSLSHTLIGISLCYTELQTTGDNFLSNLTNLKFLDVSGNTQLNLSKSMFHTISTTLERLDVRDANVEKLEWTNPLTNLRVLNLNDNKIRYLDNNSFSHMLYLKDLNLEKNSLGNWYSRLFTQNQELETLNLRENAIQMLTTDMIQDLLSVRHLAIGKNKFECSCSLYNFMLILFESTKNADMAQLQDRFNFDYSDVESRTTPHAVSIGMRSNLRPEYDIISRTYQKFYDQILRSIEALNKHNYIRKSRLLSLTDVKRLNDLPFHTILFDYDENNEDYQCMNVTEKQKQSMLDLIDFCDDANFSEKDPPYSGVDDFFIKTLSTSLSLVIIFFILLCIIYWKWWYIRYFCILCKNSAILSFMIDDNDDGKETIVRRTSTSSIDLFLYDVFVSYSDYNRPWVLDEFIPNIEKRESINVCLHERDFTVGYGILENIISCMDRSRVLLLLISEKFLESQWCQFEMNLAQHRLLETRKEKLIVVLLEDIPPKNQPKTLRYLMRTKTYIKWPENGSNDEKQLFWKRLKKSIISTKWEHENYGSTA
ncbi:hypothetical protein ACKWTF_003562 [Chironomus riparius]